MVLTSGARLGPYEIVGPLGQGGMGEVYRAHDPKLGRDVAIKVLPEIFSADPERLARFEREARVLASLNHPHIGAIYGLEETGGVRALVLEFVEGPTLADRIAQKPIPLEEALRIARQIVDALQTAHHKGIIHRDLKPANIKLRSDGAVKVLDFGLAKALIGDSVAAEVPGSSLLESPTLTSPAHTVQGAILGTAPYMSPEQARGKAVDSRSDIWAFGCVLFEMLARRRAFGGDEVPDVVASVLAKEPDWSALPRDTPAAIRRLLRRCLEKDRERRLADIADARFEIEEALYAPAEAAVPSATAPRGRERLAWVLLAAAVVGLGVLGITTARLVRRATPPEPIVTRFEIRTPPTTDPISFALSPDGRKLVFVATHEGTSRLWVRPLDEISAHPLAGTDGAAYPFWSPDSRSVGFFADGKVKRIDLVGGSPQLLADAALGRGGAWNADGVILFAPSGTSGLMRIPAAGGVAVPVTRLAPKHGSHRWPQFLPDGRRFLFFVGLGGLETQGVYLGSLDGGEPTRLMAGETAAQFAPPDRLLLVRQGVLDLLRFDPLSGRVGDERASLVSGVGSDATLLRSSIAVSATGVLAHRVSATGRRQLMWLDRSGKAVGVVGTPDESAIGAPSLSPDGRRVAVQRTVQQNTDVWSIDVARGVASRSTSEPGNDSVFIWSPDSRRVVFRSFINARFDLFEKTISEGEGRPRPLLVSLENKTPTSWSSDGKFLLYSVQGSETGGDLWVFPMLAQDRKPFTFLQTPFDEAAGEFSPDGRWVAYQSNETNRYEVYVRPFPGPGEQILISAGGGVQPRWRPDGNELFYVAADQRLMAVPIKRAASGQVLEAGTPSPLFMTRLATGSNVVTFGYAARPQYAVAANGRFLMNVGLDDASAPPIAVVLNWDAAVRK